MKAGKPKQSNSGVPSSLINPPSRRELCLVGAVVVLGAALRLAALPHSAVEHFDEGVYASNLFFGPPEYAYPQQRFFGPPLLPACIETGMMIGAPPNLAALLPSFLAGCGTIAALWWFGRSWFGPRVGIGAGALAALSGFHVTYSSAALTDVLLGLWLVMAVDAIARSFAFGDLRWAVGAGLFTGLAWWTKYNGWLPLAIGVAAAALLWAIARRDRESGIGGRGFGGRLACLVVMAVVAAAVWSPFYFSLQEHGGYAAIAENHARYLVGLSGWLDAAARQAASFELMEKNWFAVALLVGMLLVAILGASNGGTVWSLGKLLLIGTGVVLSILVALGSSLVSLGILAALGLAGAINRLFSLRGPELDWRAAVGTSILAAWWAGLLIATPCYWPYPRLLLPWLLASWLGVAIFLDELVRRFDLRSDDTEVRSRRRFARWSLPVIAVVALAAAIPLGRLCGPADSAAAASFGSRRSLVAMAKQMQSDLDRIGPRPAGATSELASRAIYVYGEPGLFFQLAAAGEPAVAPAQEVAKTSVIVAGRTIPTFLVAGPHAQRDPQFVRQLEAMRDRWRLIGEYPYAPSRLVWLDLHDPRRSQAPNGHKFSLYQFVP